MTSVRVIADDLAGALDSGAGFVGMCGPLAVGWRSDFKPQADSYIIDSETRSEVDTTIALERSQRHLGEIAGADYPFKKIDSLMRGHTIAELSACIQSRRFASIIVAPAFPKQRRITEDGQQFADFTGNGEWRATGANLTDALRAHAGNGVPLRRLAANESAAGSGIFVCDAASDADLASVPTRVAGVEQPILWCGTAGLAYALADGKTVTRRLPAGSTLVIVGSNHPVSQSQVDALAAKPEMLCWLDGNCDPRGLRQFIQGRLCNGEIAVIAADFGSADSAAIRRELASVFRDTLPRLQPPGLVLVTGGETLLLVLEAIGAQSAVVEGEVIPGIAYGRVVGGVWNSVAFASKSGAFGTASTLTDLLEARGGGSS
jgi:uncharacterized protein YgbK (DUF1537 family)